MRNNWVAWSLAAQLMAAATGFVTNITYARLLPLSSVGVVALLNAIAIFLTVLVDRGLGAVLTQKLAHQRISSRTALISAWTTGWPILILLATLELVVVLAANGSDWLPPYLWLSIPLVASFWAFQLGLMLAQGANQPLRRAAGIALNGVATFFATLVALSFHPTVPAAVVAGCAGYLAAALVMFHGCGLRQPETRSADSRALVGEAYPIFGANLATYAIATGDIILASVLMNDRQLGLYSLAKKLGQSLVLPFISLLPMLMARLSRIPKVGRAELLLKVLSPTAGLLIIGNLVLAFTVVPVVTFLFGSSFAPIGITVNLLVMAFTLQFVKDALGSLATSVGEFALLLRANLWVIGTFLLLSLGVGANISMPTELFAGIMAASFLVGVVAFTSPLRRLRILDSRQTGTLTATAGAVVATGFVAILIGSG